MVELIEDAWPALDSQNHVESKFECLKITPTLLNTLYFATAYMYIFRFYYTYVYVFKIYYFQTASSLGSS